MNVMMIRGAQVSLTHLVRNNIPAMGAVTAKYSIQSRSTKILKTNGPEGKGNGGGRGCIAAAAAVAVAAVTFNTQDEKSEIVKKKDVHEVEIVKEIIEEENRVRSNGPPDRVFHHFAGYQVVDKKGKTVMMSPMDFYNAITPGSRLTHGSHGYGPGVYTEVKVEDLPEVTSTLEKAYDPDNESILNKIGKKGLLSYSDFCVLVGLLSTPKRHVDTAFQLFDVTGSGSISAKEFAYVSTQMAYRQGGYGQYTEVDQKRVLESNSGLLNFLFGIERDGRITKEQFYNIQSMLLDEIMELQFSEIDTEHTGRISEVDFCKWLLQTAKLTSKKKQTMLKKVEKRWPTQGQGVSLGSFKKVYHVLAGGADLERALFYLDVEGIGVDLEEFKRISSWVSHMEPSPHTADVMFVLLDYSGDGRLYQDTLAPVIFQWRHSRGFDQSNVRINMGLLKV